MFIFLFKLHLFLKGYFVTLFFCFCFFKFVILKVKLQFISLTNSPLYFFTTSDGSFSHWITLLLVYTMWANAPDILRNIDYRQILFDCQILIGIALSGISWLWLEYMNSSCTCRLLVLCPTALPPPPHVTRQSDWLLSWCLLSRLSSLQYFHTKLGSHLPIWLSPCLPCQHYTVPSPLIFRWPI